MIARVFPRQTRYTPVDDYAFIGTPPAIGLSDDIDEVHVSVAFTFDQQRADDLADMWRHVAPVKIGGPATPERNGEFVPGRYLKKGITITSRGCPNDCWFCEVWKRHNREVVELPIQPGHIVQDDNLLACSRVHIERVFGMLDVQAHKGCAIEFKGGLEAARLEWWHVEHLWDLRPSSMFFAYDTPDDREPLFEAGRMLRIANFTRSHLRCYVLMGWPGDNMRDAENRLLDAWMAGFLPFGMLWMDKHGNSNEDWDDLQRAWDRPSITKAKVKKLCRERMRAKGMSDG